MARSLFITGASGFIGRHLLARLAPRRYERIFCLTRRASAVPGLVDHPNVTWLTGSLFDSDRYRNCLDASVTVIHLAAATGKALPREYYSVNRDGTRRLLECCRERRVRNFLHVSSIAANYRDKAHYDYAQSKLESEEIVAKSGLSYTILRPTIVAGQDSTGWKTLARLAQMRLVPVFGDGSARIQPIDVDDLADAMISIIDREDFRNESFDIGGPDVLTMEELLRKMHRLNNGDEAKIVRLPYGPMRLVVTCAESLLPSLLPVNAGQLSVFVQDGTVASNRLHDERRPFMKDLDTMLRGLVQ